MFTVAILNSPFYDKNKPIYLPVCTGGIRNSPKRLNLLYFIKLVLLSFLLTLRAGGLW